MKKSPNKIEKVLIFGDIHIPYHDKVAWNLFLKVATEFKPHHLICMGDFADMYTTSSFSKDPARAFRLPQELADVNKQLDRLDALGAKNKVFIAGNHEARLANFLMTRAPELFSLLSLPDLLKLKQRKWAYVAPKAFYTLGKVHFAHEGKTTGKGALRAALDMYQHCVITGHSHRFGSIVEGNVLREHKISASFGCLCDFNKVDYAKQAQINQDWALGFGLGYYEVKSGIIHFVPVPIIEGTCMVEGRLYK